jgi:hypothetical protein
VKTVIQHHTCMVECSTMQLHYTESITHTLHKRSRNTPDYIKLHSSNLPFMTMMIISSLSYSQSLTIQSILIQLFQYVLQHSKLSPGPKKSRPTLSLKAIFLNIAISQLVPPLIIPWSFDASKSSSNFF